MNERDPRDGTCCHCGDSLPPGGFSDLFCSSWCQRLGLESSADVPDREPEPSVPDWERALLAWRRINHPDRTYSEDRPPG